MVPNRVQSSSARPTRADQAGADAVGELHDLWRELRGARAHGPEELEDDGLELAMCAEGLEHGERKRDERHQRQQRRVHQAHGMQVDLAARQVAQQRVGVAQAGAAPARRASALRRTRRTDSGRASSRTRRSSWRRRISGPTTAVSRLDCRAWPRRYPTRIVCLTEETTETLYLLGEEARIVGISGFTVRPPRARREKPGVGVHQREDRQDRGAAAGPRARLLRPAGRHRRGAHPRRHRGARLQSSQRRRDPAHDRDARRHGGLRGEGADARRGARGRARRRCAAAPRASRAGRASTSRNGTSRRSPASAGSRSSSASPAATIAFPSWRSESLGKNRIIADPLEVPRRAPDVIFGSWCGKKFRPETVAARAGLERCARRARRRICYEIKSSIILQPGPAALTDGVRGAARRSQAWRRRRLTRQPCQRLADTWHASSAMTSGGSFGPGACLFQSSVSR